MKKFWPVPVTILAGLLVLLVVVRDLSLPGLTEKREKAVAELNEKIKTIVKEPGATPASSRLTAHTDPVDKSANERWAEIRRKVAELTKKLGNPPTCRQFGGLQNAMFVLDCHKASDEQTECLKTIVSENQELIDEIYALCSNRDTVLPLHWGPKGEPAWRETINALVDMQTGLDLLAVRAFLNAVSGNSSTAKDEVMAAANQWNGPLLQWGKKSITAAIFETVYALLGSNPPDIASAEQLFRLFQEFHTPEIHRIDMAEMFFEDVRMLTEAEHHYPEMSFPLNVAWWGYTTVCRPVYEYDMRAYADGVRQVLEAADLPYYQAVPTLRKVSTNLAQSAVPRPPYDATREFKWHMSARAECQTGEDLMRIAIALHKFRNEKGGFPDALDDLKELLGGTVPVEPCSGGPYKYARTENGFTLSCRIPVFDWGTEFNKSKPFTW